MRTIIKVEADELFVTEWQIPHPPKRTIFERRRLMLTGYIRDHKKLIMKVAKEISTDVLVTKVIESLIVSLLGG